MIFYNFFKAALEEIWYEYRKNISMCKKTDNTIWNLFANISLTMIIFIFFFIILIPFDILFSPLEIAVGIYYFIKEYK